MSTAERRRERTVYTMDARSGKRRHRNKVQLNLAFILSIPIIKPWPVHVILLPGNGGAKNELNVKVGLPPTRHRPVFPGIFIARERVYFIFFSGGESHLQYKGRDIRGFRSLTTNRDRIYGIRCSARAMSPCSSQLPSVRSSAVWPHCNWCGVSINNFFHNVRRCLYREAHR